MKIGIQDKFSNFARILYVPSWGAGRTRVDNLLSVMGMNVATGGQVDLGILESHASSTPSVTYLPRTQKRLQAASHFQPADERVGGDLLPACFVSRIRVFPLIPYSVSRQTAVQDDTRVEKIFSRVGLRSDLCSFLVAGKQEYASSSDSEGYACAACTSLHARLREISLPSAPQALKMRAVTVPERNSWGARCRWCP